MNLSTRKCSRVEKTSLNYIHNVPEIQGTKIYLFSDDMDRRLTVKYLM